MDSRKFGIVDYVRKICPQTKFGDRSMGASGGICETYNLSDFLYFFQGTLEATSLNQLSHKMA